jgi:hypothetical protein
MNAEPQWIPRTLPAGEIKDGDLVFRIDPIPNSGKDEVVVKKEWLVAALKSYSARPRRS